MTEMNFVIGLLFAVAVILCVVVVAQINLHARLWRLHRAMAELDESQCLLAEEIKSMEESIGDRLEVVHCDLSEIQLCVELIPKWVFGTADDRETSHRREA